MSNSIDNFIEKLTKVTERSGGSGSGSNNYKWINKVRMVLPENHGTIYGIGVSTKSGSPATIVDGVREVKVDGTDSTWIKILPKSFYNIKEGSKEDKLYGELCSLHSSMLDESSGISWKLRRWHNYLLIYMYVLKLKTKSGDVIREQSPCLLIFDHRAAENALKAEISSKMDLAGSSAFMDKFFNRDNSGRNALITIIYDKVGKDCTCSFQFNSISEDHYGITGNKSTIEFNESYLDLMNDPVDDLLSVDDIDNRFNYDYFLEVRNKMMRMLGHEVPVDDNKDDNDNNSSEESTNSIESSDEQKSKLPDLPF